MLRAITGSITLSSKLPDAPANAIAASLPITWAQTIRVASGITGLTLPGMMLDPGCRSGRWISASPVVGPLAIQRRSLQIFTSPTAYGAQHAAELDDGVRPPCASKWSRASVNDSPVASLSRWIVRAAKSGGALMPVPTAVPPSGSSRTRGSTDSDPLAGAVDDRGVAGELLAEGDRGGVHQVGAAGLDGVGELLGLAQRGRRGVSRGRSAGRSAPSVGGDVDRGREGVVGGLRRR